jgi:cell wall-associated NlpC family hydrolase
MFTASLLDLGDQHLTRGLAGAALAIVMLLMVAVCLPVLVMAVLLGAGQVAGAPPTVTALTTAAPPAEEAPGPPPLASASTSPARSAGAADPPSTLGLIAIDVARRYLGVRYVFGGTNPAIGLDCSGLVQLVFRQLGVNLPRTAQQQYAATSRLTRAQLQPGDLVFFARTYADPNDWITHVGIYIGDGQQINAPTEGQVVSVQPVFTGFWGDHFAGGGRVAAH